ncbi:MAG: hypothetical protein ABJB40_11720 [Acidobacteriota bacterium]
MSADRLRIVSLIAGILGAVVSVFFVLAARQQAPYSLVALFVVWGLAPFVALIFGNKLSKPWPPVIRITLYVVTLVVSMISPAIYCYFVVWPRQSTPAAPFVLVPPLTGAFAVIAVAVAALLARSRENKNS